MLNSMSGRLVRFVEYVGRARAWVSARRNIGSLNGWNGHMYSAEHHSEALSCTMRYESYVG